MPPKKPLVDIPGEDLYKVLVVGDRGVGKTCLIRRYVQNVFHASTKSTIGVDFALKTVSQENGRNVSVQFWDIAGQEQNTNMCKVFFKSAVGAIVVASVDISGSFDAAVEWKKDLDSKVFLPNGSNVPAVLLVNKSDLHDCPKSKGEMDQFCKDHNFAAWHLVSAKKDTNVANGFEDAVKKVLEASPSQSDSSGVESITVNLSRPQKQENGKCPC